MLENRISALQSNAKSLFTSNNIPVSRAGNLPGDLLNYGEFCAGNRRQAPTHLDVFPVSCMKAERQVDPALHAPPAVFLPSFRYVGLRSPTGTTWEFLKQLLNAVPCRA